MISKEMSEAIKNLRFPLIFAIIANHICMHILATKGITWNHFWVQSLFKLVGTFGSYIGVTGFLFISGYLFFSPNMDYAAWRNKIKTRVDSLLMPYIYWNTIVLVFFLLIELFLPSLSLSRGSLLKGGISGMLWNYVEPIAIQFWFIKDLFIVCLIAVAFIPMKKFRLFHFGGVFY